MNAEPIITLKGLMTFQWNKPGVAEPTHNACWKMTGLFLTHRPGRRMRGKKWRETKWFW